MFRPGSDEIQTELRKRESQLREKASQVQRHEAQLREQLLEQASQLQKQEAQLREQLLEQASRLQKQEAQLREQADRLLELAEFEQQSKITGGIFISYSHDDKDFVDILASRLDKDEIKYWRDEKNLFIGDILDKAISQGIQESLLFLIVLTPTSISSRWVGRELDEAAHAEVEGRKIVLPVIANGLTAEQVPARLRNKVYLDLNKSFEDGYAKLTRSIRHHLQTHGPGNVTLRGG